MVVEIHGTGTHNRGAELMAISIADRLRRLDPNIRIVVDPYFGTYEERAKHRFRTLNSFSRKSLSRAFGSFAPKRFRECLGLVHEGEIDVVLDASGFAFSDQWGPNPGRMMARVLSHSWRRHQKLVLLPQALGPFKNAEVADSSRQLFDRSELIFARDQQSFDSMGELGYSRKVQKCPDFTIAMPGVPVGNLPVSKPFGAIVPNIRMLDKTDDREGTVYLRLLADAARQFESCGIQPLIVLHDAREDRRLLPKLNDHAGQLPVYTSADPLELKGVLGQAEVVIGSRFHALVGALSQGVPCVGAGWSHKYKWLFHDFGCESWLLQDLKATEQLQQLLEVLGDATKKEELCQTLRANKERMLQEVEGMWQQVESLLGYGKTQSANQTVSEHRARVVQV